MRQNLKTFALAVSVMELTSGCGLANDFPSLEGPPPQPPQSVSWTGFYTGLNAGYLGGANSSATTSTSLQDDPAMSPLAAFGVGKLQSAVPLNPASVLQSGASALANGGVTNLRQDGFIGGGQIGYNWQARENIILGIEADIQGLTGRGSGSYLGASEDSFSGADISLRETHSANNLEYVSALALRNPNLRRSTIGFGQLSANVDWMGTVRGRIGYLVTPTLMIYGTGGLAYGGVNASVRHSGATSYNYSLDALGMGYGVSRTLSDLRITFGSNPYSVDVFTYATLRDATFPARAFTNGPGQSHTDINRVAFVIALAHASSSYKSALIAPNAIGVARSSNTNVGWSVGGGVEWMFMPNWSLKAEGLYYYLGSLTLRSTPVSHSIGSDLLYPSSLRNALASVNAPALVNATLVVANAPVTRIKFDGYIARLGVNYHFDWGSSAPPIAPN